MNRIRIYSAALALSCACLSMVLHARITDDSGTTMSDDLVKNTVDKEIKKASSSKKKTFSFKFVDENLIDVINAVAEKKGVNVAIPAPNSANAINSKVTISIEDKMSPDKAWEFLIQILDIAGYSVVPSSGIHQIVKTTPDVAREALPIYIGVPWDQIPDTEQRIRCVFYLSNIKVPGDPPEPDNELYKVITALLPNGQTGVQDPRSPRLAFDPITNALIIAERASIVRSIMQIVSALDTTGFKEKIEMLPLFNTVASDVKNIFDEIMKSPTTNPYRLDARKPTSEATYFSKFVRIIPYGRLNMLIILGREQAVDRVKEFIQKYIDVAQDTGQSVFHVYSLQYLEAATFAPILQNIVKSASTGGTGQSRAEGATAAQGGTERVFEGVIVTSDTPAVDQNAASASGEAKADTIYYGGNRLIIAARHDDWLRIKKLCEELDTPQPQVIIEVLVADLTLDDSRMIGSMLRNSLTVPLIDNVQFQSAQLNPGILVDNPNIDDGVSPATVGLDNLNHNNDADILRDAYTVNSQGQATPITNPARPSQSDVSIASQADPGTMAISLIDPCTKKVWSLLEIENLLDYRKVLTNPHIVAVNNKQTKLVIGETRLVADAAVGNQGGNATVPKKKIPANLVLNLKPRICLSPDGDPANDTIQLAIDVEINEFTASQFTATADNPQGANTYKRHVTTSAHVRSREVIPLGGLLQRDTTQTLSETPPLGRIPIIGYFFKNRGGTAIDTNLTVFLCPTVIRPRLRRGGVDRYTRDYVKLTKKYAQEGMLFDSLKDPITRWFFKTESDVNDTVNDFLADDEFKQSEIRVLSKRSEACAEARKARAAKDLEYREMQAKDEEPRAMNESVSSPVVSLRHKEKAMAPLQEIKPELLESKPIQEVCNRATIEIAAQCEDMPEDNETRLKMLIQNEENPLQSYLPA